jgi:uridine kinase
MSVPQKPKRKNVVMASHGRAPWYGPDGKNVEAYVIGIAGGSASGKVSYTVQWRD